jgi:effector-binding domain-containing protein
MSKYLNIVNSALSKIKKRGINEGVLYPEGMVERMHQDLEDDLKNKNHSLGKHPIFPEDDEATFEEKIMGERFLEVAKRYKRNNDVTNIDNKKVMVEMGGLLKTTMDLEKEHIKELEKLAVDIIREEYDMDKDVVEIIAEIVPTITIEGFQKKPKPIFAPIEFKNHDEMSVANEEVYKRRFLNAMIQGASKKVNHMFHMFDDEITEMNPRLPNTYAKLMSAADYMFYIVPAINEGITGGAVKVTLPSKNNPKATIYAQAMVFPVLIHELVKGVMEIVAAHGLPSNKKIAQFVVDKADFMAAEPWDMRLGPGLWERFTNLIDPDDFNLKHHIFAELASLPVKEFNNTMREIMANTKEGKKIISNIVKEVKEGLKDDEFNEAIGSVNNIDVGNAEEEEEENDKEGFDIDELFGSKDSDKPDEDDGFNLEDLL